MDDERESDARTHRTPKALRAKLTHGLFCFCEALRVRTRPRIAFAASLRSQISG
jgi:hypothetical protein